MGYSDRMNANEETYIRKLIAELILTIQTGNYSERLDAERRLSSIGSDAVEPLMQAYESAEGDIRLEIYETLAAIADTRSLPIFLEEAKTAIPKPPYNFRTYEEFDVQLIETLGSFNDPRPVPILREILHEVGKEFKRGELAQNRVLSTTMEALRNISKSIQASHPELAAQIAQEAKTISLATGSAGPFVYPIYHDNIEFSILSEVIDLSPVYVIVEGEGTQHLPSFDYLPLDGIEQCQNLRELILQGNPLGGIDLKPLAACLKLEVLDISNCGLHSLDVSPLQNLPTLHTLNLDNNEIYCMDITPLFDCPNLTTAIGIGAKMYAHPSRKDQDLIPPALEKIKEKIIWGEFDEDCYNPI